MVNSIVFRTFCDANQATAVIKTQNPTGRLH